MNMSYSLDSWLLKGVSNVTVLGRMFLYYRAAVDDDGCRCFVCNRHVGRDLLRAADFKMGRASMPELERMDFSNANMRLPTGIVRLLTAREFHVGISLRTFFR